MRSYGKLPDKRIDASVLGLVYPFEVYDVDDLKMVAAINKLEKRLLVNGGVHRYQYDDYDGLMNNGNHMKKGSGEWPILNFWMSVINLSDRTRQKQKNIITGY